jgi:hypothetical protein
MDADLDLIVAALAALNDGELLALIDATYKAPQIAPGLLAWIEGALERPLQNADLDRPKLAGSRGSECAPKADGG